MVKKIKFSKLAIVIFLTLLIWVWADRALEEQYPIQTASIVIGRTRPELQVSFPQGSTIDVNRIDLSGPASIINDLDDIINKDPGKLEFTLSPNNFGIDKAGEYTIDVQDIIEQSNWIKKSVLSVIYCDPSKVQVVAVELKKQEIDVRCYNEDNLPINLEGPVKVSMYVTADWRLPANVILSDDDITEAIQRPISVKPFIILNGERREADSFVDIKLPPQETILQPARIAAKLSYDLSETLLGGQYNIDVDNLRDILAVEIRATTEAKEAYEAQNYQIGLEILNSDLETTIKNKFVRRKVSYKLPEEYVRSKKIEVVEKKEAVFSVTKIEQPNEN